MFRSSRDTVRTPVKVNTTVVKKKYYCDLCDPSQKRVWEEEEDVELHRRNNHKNKILRLLKEPDNFMCTVCLRPQEDKQSLIAHIKTQHLLSPAHATRIKRECFICDYCNKIFFNKTLLIAHIRWFHLSSKAERGTTLTKCPLCHKHITVKALWFHFMHHKIVHPGTCPVCVSLFADYNDVIKHIDTHPGCYRCNICPYEAKNENLFLNHIERHTKMVNLEGKDVKAVRKYFVPQTRAATWNQKYVNVFRGTPLASEIKICILCCTMCETDNDLLHHIYGDHSPQDSVNIKRHLCACGEEFFNAVLLKHHVFTMKGNHRPYDGLSPPNFKRIESTRATELSVKSAEIEITVERHVPFEFQKEYSPEFIVDDNQRVRSPDETRNKHNLLEENIIDETVDVINVSKNESNNDENIMCYEIKQKPDSNKNSDGQIMCVNTSEGNEANDSQNETNDSQNETNNSQNYFNDTTFEPSEVYCKVPLVTIKTINKEGQYSQRLQAEIVYEESEVPNDAENSQRATVED